MHVILLENVPRLGKIGEVVAVRNGFGRNFLIPQHKATRATDENKQAFESRRAALEERDREQKAAAETRAKELAGIRVRVVRQASEDGRLYGSVSVRDVAQALEEAGYAIQRRQIDLASGIKHIGAFEASILLHADVRVPFRVEVVRSLDTLLVQEIEEKAEESSPATSAPQASPEEE